MRAFSIDLRERVLADCDAGLSTRDVSSKYRVSPSWVRELKRQRRQTGNIAPRVRGKGRQTKLGGRQEELRRLVQEQPDATLEELRDRLGIGVSIGTLWKALRDLKLRF